MKADVQGNINVTIGQRVRIVMEEKGMKLMEVAAKMDCHESKISKITNGTYNISAKDLQKLAQILQVPMAYLQGEINCTSLKPNSYLKEVIHKIIVSLLKMLPKNERLEVIQELRFDKS